MWVKRHKIAEMSSEEMELIFIKMFINCSTGSCKNIQCSRWWWHFLFSDVDAIDPPDNKVHGANMGPTWVLSAPDGPHVGPVNLVFRARAYHPHTPLAAEHGWAGGWTPDTCRLPGIQQPSSTGWSSPHESLPLHHGLNQNTQSWWRHGFCLDWSFVRESTGYRWIILTKNR